MTDQREERASARKERALWTIARNVKPTIINRGLVLGLGLLALDAMAVARFRPSTALAVVRFTPPLTLLVGVMLNLAPLLAKATIAGLLLLAAYRYLSDRSDWIQALMLSVAAFVVSNAFIDVTLAMSTRVFISLFVATVVGTLALRFLVFASEELSSFVSFLMPFLVVLLGGFVVVTVWISEDLRTAIAQPYVPPERISVSEGDEIVDVVGYVLDVDPSGQWTTIMVDETREIMILRSFRVRSRTVCTVGEPPEVAPRWAIVDPLSNQGNRC